MNSQICKARHAVFGCMLLLIGSCGGDPAPEVRTAQQDEARTTQNATTDAAAIDACSFLSKEEAETALNVSLQDPELTPFNPVTKSSECNFAAADPDAGFERAGNLVIRVEQPSNAKASFDRLREMMGEVEEIDGLGDEAFFATQLFVLDDTYQVTVTVGLFGKRGAERREIAVAVAEIVLSRL